MGDHRIPMDAAGRKSAFDRLALAGASKHESD
jgi:hypothetical protein